jgi:hypothetical protein
VRSALTRQVTGIEGSQVRIHADPWLRALRPWLAGRKTLAIAEGGGVDVCAVALLNPSPAPSVAATWESIFIFGIIADMAR